jgi:hypothetical protein
MPRNSDRRRFGRRTVCKPATVVQNATQKLPCTVVDVSEGGARIRMVAIDSLAGEFMLVIPEDDVVYDCRLVRRLPDSAGVEFTRMPRRLSWLVGKVAILR